MTEGTGASAGMSREERRKRRRQSLAQRRVEAIRARHSAQRSVVQQLADRLTRIASSTPFLLFHACWFGGWIALNVGALGIEPFDPFPFGLLTMVVSLEAIFLSIFVLMTQNRESAIEELREEMTLEVDMRMEEEVTKTLQLVVGLYGRLGFSIGDDQDLREMLEPLDKSRIEQELAAELNNPYRRGSRTDRSEGR